MKKKDIISKLYYDPAGFGSLKTTLADARAVDPATRMPDVKKWFEEHSQIKKQVCEQKSFVANCAFHAYQLHLLFISNLVNQEYTVALVCIDSFSKYAVVQPIEGKTHEDLGYAMISAFVKNWQSS